MPATAVAGEGTDEAVAAPAPAEDSADAGEWVTAVEAPGAEVPEAKPDIDPHRPLSTAEIKTAAAAWGGNWASASGETGFDDAGWITPKNVTDVASQLKRQQKASKKAVYPVGCITTDFAMQNVALQMGLNIVSLDGMEIRHVKTFALMCSSCDRVSHETDRKFCRGCGNPTLFKITVIIMEDGAVKCVKKGNGALN